VAPEGLPDARFVRDLRATLAYCLKLEQDNESALLRRLATRYLRSLPSTLESHPDEAV
jgi:hypothetical protein